MEALFGPFWGYVIVPTMLGLAVLLIVLALKPSRWVARSAIGFAVVCALIGIGMAVDSNRSAARAAAYGQCLSDASGDTKAKYEKCSRLLGDRKMGFIGNEAYAE